MPDGRRKRRHGPNQAKRQWYARHRAARFRRKFGLSPDPAADRPRVAIHVRA
jgi:hypothetical protein